jgi:hypothetical protein
MTKDEFFERNIGITFDFLRYLVDNPEFIDKIPDGIEINFIDKNMPCKDDSIQKRKKSQNYKVKHFFEVI